MVRADEHQDRLPRFALILVIALILVLLYVLVLNFRWRRDRDLYVRKAARLAAVSSVFKSPAYAQGLIAVGWPLHVGFILILGSALWGELFQVGGRGLFWVLMAATLLIYVGMVLPYFYWPRWAMPTHARHDLSPFQIRRKGRRDPTLRRRRRRDRTN